VTGFNNGSLRTNSSAPAVSSTAGNSSSNASSNATASNSTAGGLGEQAMQLQPLNVTATPAYVVPLKVGCSALLVKQQAADNAYLGWRSFCCASGLAACFAATNGQELCC
jgi:hypothetical protein